MQNIRGYVPLVKHPLLRPGRLEVRGEMNERRDFLSGRRVALRRATVHRVPRVDEGETFAGATPRRDHVMIDDRVLEIEMCSGHGVRPHISEDVFFFRQNGLHVP